MKKITRISRVDVKRGASCRTDSTLSIFIEKHDLSDVLAYMDTYEAGKEPEGKIKKITLVLEYEEDLTAIEHSEEIEKTIIDIDRAMTEVVIPQWDSSVVYEKDTEVMFNGKKCLVGGEHKYPYEVEEEL